MRNNLENYLNISTFLMGFSTAFFTLLAVYILFYPAQRTRFQKVLGCILAVWAVSNLKDLVLTFPGMYVPDVLNWIILIDGWSAITYTVFVLEVTMPGWTTWRRLLLFCVPWLFFTFVYIFWPSQTVINAYIAFLWFYAWTVVVVCYVRSRRYISYIKRNYSNLEHIDISWLTPVFLFAVCSQLSWLFTSLYASVLGDIVYYATTLILWILVLYYSWDFKPISVVQEESGVAQSRYSINESLLDEIMQTTRPYLNKNLTMQQLAQSLGTNRTYLSQYLSRVRNQTFYDYINQIRIERACIPLMEKHPEYTIERIADESGFGSVSTLRRAYMKCTGNPLRRKERSV